MKKAYYLLILGMVFLTSFLPHLSSSEKNAAATAKCTWHAIKSDIPYVSIENASGMDATSNILQSTSWTSSLLVGGSTTNILTQLPGPHSAGTILIYENGILVKTHIVTASAISIVYDDYFPVPAASSYAHYDVYWQ